jgi:PAP2 superfamily
MAARGLRGIGRSGSVTAGFPDGGDGGVCEVCLMAVRRQHALQPAPRLAAAREIALVTAAWLVYFGVRAISEGRASAAFDHSLAIWELERSLGIDWEMALQEVTLGNHALMTLANWVYIWGHWPVIAVVAVWLYRRRRDGYRLLRNAMFISGAIGMVVFAVYPVAPPRLVDLGLVDSVTTWSHAYRALQPPSLTNPYAALPSLHFGWNLLVGIMVVSSARSTLLRVVGGVFPFAMMLAVVATANHYVLDVVAGGALALLGLGTALLLQPGTLRPWIKAEDETRHPRPA